MKKGDEIITTVYYEEGKKQVSKGIIQWPINLCTSPMMIHKITPSVDYNQWPKLNEPTNQNSMKVKSCYANE